MYTLTLETRKRGSAKSEPENKSLHSILQLLVDKYHIKINSVRVTMELYSSAEELYSSMVTDANSFPLV